MARIVPTNPAIFHITHVKNLPNILRDGGLCSDSERIRRGLTTTNIGHKHIRDRRLKRPVPVAAGGTLGDYVPFYFCSRSVMLYPIYLGKLKDVEVLGFEPKGAPPPAEMKNTTPRPRMTSGRAAVLALMNRYLVPGYDYLLSLLEVQKLAYFLQVAGEPLRLDYKAHFYGPYADNLRHVLHHIEGHYIEGFGDGENKPATPLKLLPGAAAEAESFISASHDAQTRLLKVAELIEGYETPFGMELLSTVHWVAVHDVDAGRSADAAVTAVHAWNDRKATTMRPEQIRAAWAHLKERGWVAESSVRLS